MNKPPITNNEQGFEWKDALKILLAALAFGIGWFADNQVTVIAFASSALVWAIGWLVQLSPKFAWIKGKGPLTVLVFAVSFGLSYLFAPFALPAFPGWPGDAGSFVPLLSEWFSALFGIVGSAVVFAMSIYNLLLAQVYEKTGDALSHLLPVRERG